jgi:N-acetylglucosamine malate deacetylase 2
MTRSRELPPWWKSVLVVIAHPDDEPFGLGAVLDAFIFAGVRVRVLCLTHGQAWALHGAPGDLAALRGAELASAADVLGARRAKLSANPDGALSEASQTTLAAEVVAAAHSSRPDGMLVFDTAGLVGHVDHVAATSAALLAAGALDLPVLGWTLSETVAAQLNQEFGSVFTERRDEEIDLRVTFDRARRRLASRENAGRAVPGSTRWRRLEMLADTKTLRWLRQPTVVLGSPDP